MPARPPSSLPAALWATVVAALLLTPGSSAALPPWLAALDSLGLDKVVHAVLFFVQAATVGRWLGGRRRGTSPLVAVFAAAAYGALLEGMQAGIGGRAADAGDVLANCVGASLWWAVTKVSNRQR